jgi:glycosyltransferase involved in cell wall biosynthesis
MKKKNGKHVVIIQNTTLADNFGLSTYLRNINLNLSRIEELHVSLICSKANSNDAACPKNIDLYELPTSTYSLKDNAKFFIKTYKLLRSINNNKRINIVHCLYPNSSLAAAVLFKITRKKKIEIIYDLRSPWILIALERKSIPKIFSYIFKILAYSTEFILSIFVNKFIFITSGLNNYYKKFLYINKKNVYIIPSGISISFFKNKRNLRNRYHIDKDELVVGYIGAVSNLELIINAISKLPHKYKLLIVGDGDALNSLKLLVKTLELESRIIFTGRIDPSLSNKFVATFDIGICQLPDTFVFRQSYPMKILEYLACGMPVLASDIKAHRDIQAVFPQVKLYKSEEELTMHILTTTSLHRVVPSALVNYDWKNIARRIYETY